MKVKDQLKKTKISDNSYMAQTIFVTYSEDIEEQLKNSKIENVLSVKTKMLNTLMNEYEKVNDKNYTDSSSFLVMVHIMGDSNSPHPGDEHSNSAN